MNAFGRFLKKRPRLLQAICPHECSDYVGQCVKVDLRTGKKDERPVYKCSVCGLYRLGDKYWTDPFDERKPERKTVRRRRLLRKKTYVTIPMTWRP